MRIEKMIAAVQKELGVQVDGRAGPQTWGAMKGLDISKLVKLILRVLTPAAVFYVIGYVVTQAYVIETKLQASFCFTENFYREAGASARWSRPVDPCTAGA